MINLIGYAPDQDPTTPGIITNCSALIPSMKGMKGAPSPQSTTLAALASACQGAAVLRKLDNTTRFIAGTATKLYEAGATTWSDVTRTVGGDYSPASDVRWRFAQFGNVSLAVEKNDVLQSSTTGAFANLTAPKASIVETVNQFVFLFNTNEATFGDSPDRWWCSAIGDQTDWTPAIATQCTTGRLTSSPGIIRAGKRFGDSIIVYKDRAMYLGTYYGPPIAWAFTEVPGEVGAMCQEVVINVGTPEDPRHIFMGFEDFYSFDGSRPIPIGIGWVKEQVFGELNKQYSFASIALHDRVNSRIYFYYPVASSVLPDKCVVYNYRTKKWGRDDRQIEIAVEYISAGVTYDDLGSLYSTYNDLPMLSYDSPFWSSGFPTPAIINTSHTVQTLNGASVGSSLTSGDMGNETDFTLLSRVRPRFLTAPTSATLTNFYRNNLGDSLTTDQTVNLSSGRFDFLRSARWHRVRMEFSGDVEIPGFVPYASLEGVE